MGFKTSTKTKAIKQTPSLVEKVVDRVFAQSLLKKSFIQTVRSIPDLNRHFLKFRNYSFEKNTSTFFEVALKGNESTYIPIIPINIKQKLKNMAIALRGEQKNYLAIARVILGIKSGNKKQLEYAKYLSKVNLKQAVQAGLILKAIYSRDKPIETNPLTSDDYLTYVTSIGAPYEINKTTAMNTFGITETNFQNTMREFEKSLKGIGKGLQAKFFNAMRDIRLSFGIQMVPVRNNLPVASILDNQRRIMAKEQQDKEERDQKRKDKKRRDRESRKKSSSKKENKYI